MLLLIIAVLLLILVLAIKPARELLFGIDAYVIRWARKFKRLRRQRLRRQTKGALLVLAAVLTGILIILGIVF